MVWVTLSCRGRWAKRDKTVGSENAQVKRDKAKRDGKERKRWALRPQKPLRLIIRDGEVGGGGQEFYI